jgi:hypothetical protein
MSETLQNLESKTVSRLLWGMDIENADKVDLLSQLLDRVEWEIHAIISVLWAGDMLFLDSPDLTIDSVRP